MSTTFSANHAVAIAAVATLTRPPPDAADQRFADGERRRSRSTEHALDQVLADSFPASDPPPWTPAVATTSINAARPGASPLPLVAAVVTGAARCSSRPYAEDVIVPYRGFREKRTLVQKLTSLAGVIGVAFLVPIAILIVGIPIALAARGVLEVVGWLGGGF
jgi:hypothetical protein